MAFENFSDLKSDLTTRMGKAVDVLKRDLAGLRTGRASISLLDNISVIAYGKNRRGFIFR